MTARWLRGGLGPERDVTLHLTAGPRYTHLQYASTCPDAVVNTPVKTYIGARYYDANEQPREF